MSISVSPEALSAAGFKNLASKSQLDRNLSKEDIIEVHAYAKDEIAKLKDALNDPNKKIQVLEDHMSDAGVRKDLLALIDEVVASGTVPPPAPPSSPASTPSSPAKTPPSIPANIPGSGTLRDAMKKKYDDKEYLSKWYIVLGRAPGFEVGGVDDVKDALYQSHSNMLKFVSWLESEYANPSKDFDTRSSDAGLYSFFLDKTQFSNAAEKQAYITRMIKELTDTYSDENKLMDEIIAYFTDGAKGALGIGAVTIVGLVLTALGIKWVLNKKAGGWGVSVIDAGLNGGKGLIGRAIGVADNVTGAKGRVARAAVKGTAGLVAGGLVGFPTTGAVIGAARGALQGPRNPSAVLASAAPKDLVDTPAYTLDDWTKERARLTETTRRMIYMDSRRNPGYNPNATIAEIFRDVEGTPALKTAFDARMVKLTELGNTLVGQEKYLTKEAFDKEAGRVVAGDIEKPTFAQRGLRNIPGTTEAKEAKATKEALKKVKGEIDLMRARLSAKATLDGVDIPKVLEDQFKAFETAYKAAYEADLSLDKSRNQIARTADRINAINEVIAHFEEIQSLQDKISDPVNGIDKQMADIKARIDSQRTAAHTGSPEEQRQREANGKQVEIDAALREREQAIREFDAHETAKREALKEKRAADQAVLAEEARIRKEITDRKTLLQDNITKNSGDPSKATAITEWQDEIDGKRGKIKDLNTELIPPHIGSTLAVKHQGVKDAQDAVDALTGKDIAVQRKVSDADGKISRLSGEKSGILSRVVGADAKSLTSTDTADFEALKTQKTELEGKIKAAKGAIDAIATKPENRGFPRSSGGTLLLAQNELTRLDGLIASGGTLDAAKTTAKTARNTAFSHLNATIVTLNTESARLGAGLEIPVPHIAEMVKGQGFSDDLSMRADGTTGDKAADHKLKGTRPASVKTVMTRRP